MVPLNDALVGLCRAERSTCAKRTAAPRPRRLPRAAQAAGHRYVAIERLCCAGGRRTRNAGVQSSPACQPTRRAWLQPARSTRPIVDERFQLLQHETPARPSSVSVAIGRAAFSELAPITSPASPRSARAADHVRLVARRVERRARCSRPPLVRHQPHAPARREHGERDSLGAQHVADLPEQRHGDLSRNASYSRAGRRRARAARRRRASRVRWSRGPLADVGDFHQITPRGAQLADDLVGRGPDRCVSTAVRVLAERRRRRSHGAPACRTA